MRRPHCAAAGRSGRLAVRGFGLDLGFEAAIIECVGDGCDRPQGRRRRSVYRLTGFGPRPQHYDVCGVHIADHNVAGAKIAVIVPDRGHMLVLSGGVVATLDRDRAITALGGDAPASDGADSELRVLAAAALAAVTGGEHIK